MQTMQNVKLAEAKARIHIGDIWRLCGFPGEPRKSCRCPFHDDRHESFSIFNGGLNWKCFAGCGGGDTIDFLQKARGLSPSEACREIIRLAGYGAAKAVRVQEPRPQKQISTQKLRLSHATAGNQQQWLKLADLRNVSVESIALAVKRGFLLFGTYHRSEAWFITDLARRNAQARRMDGLPWVDAGGKTKKALTLPGSQAAWSIGAIESRLFPCLAFCEGSGDMLAALHFIWCEDRESDCTAVGMLGAGLDVHPDALPLFAGKRIRIFGHIDPSGVGRQAVERWGRQLAGAGADVDAFDFTGLRKTDGALVKDLNDCTSIHADDFESNRELWRMMP